MSKKFYIKDENGIFLSTDGKIRYTLLEGKALCDFFKTEDGKRRCFHVEIDEKGNRIGIESNKNRKRKISNLIGNTTIGRNEEDKVTITVLSTNAIVSDLVDADGDYEEALIDEDMVLDEHVMHKMDLEILQKALASLSKDEYELIYALFLSATPMTERQLAAKTGIPRMTLNYRKQCIFRKIRKFF